MTTDKEERASIVRFLRRWVARYRIKPAQIMNTNGSVVGSLDLIVLAIEASTCRVVGALADEIECERHNTET